MFPKIILYFANLTTDQLPTLAESKSLIDVVDEISMGVFKLIAYCAPSKNMKVEASLDWDVSVAVLKSISEFENVTDWLFHVPEPLSLTKVKSSVDAVRFDKTQIIGIQ